MKKLKQMDRYQVSLLIGWIEKNLQDASDPRTHGKAIVANHKSKCSYRLGDYRILALIEDEKIIITIIDVGHRKDIYELKKQIRPLNCIERVSVFLWN